jgi:Excalibur calcium-binding domain
MPGQTYPPAPGHEFPPTVAGPAYPHGGAASGGPTYPHAGAAPGGPTYPYAGATPGGQPLPHGAAGYPLTVPYTAAGKPAKKPAVGKVLLGLAGVAVLFVCGAAIFAPDAPKKDNAGSVRPSAVISTEQVAASAVPVAVAPSAGPSPSPSSARATPVAPAKTTKPAPARTTAKPVYYANCDAVYAAGRSNLRRSDPGYRKALDRDGDGVACESGDADEPDEPGTGDTGDDDGGTDPRYATCAAAKRAGHGPYTKGEDPEYAWYRDADKDGVVCE